MEQVSRLDRHTVWEDLSVVLMDDAGIAEVNRKYLDNSFATDVLSFRYPSGYDEAARVRGEVIVNVERAIAEGTRRGGASSELALYVAHGCDHLSGQDDNTAGTRKRMRLRELRWLRNAKKSQGPIRLLLKEG
ncbi:rRNA maturation RNase YbeY [Verrucomicrobiota bacterium]